MLNIDLNTKLERLDRVKVARRVFQGPSESEEQVTTWRSGYHGKGE
jgi:hypothetical protein